MGNWVLVAAAADSPFFWQKKDPCNWRVRALKKAAAAASESMPVVRKESCHFLVQRQREEGQTVDAEENKHCRRQQQLFFRQLIVTGPPRFPIATSSPSSLGLDSAAAAAKVSDSSCCCPLWMVNLIV